MAGAGFAVIGQPYFRDNQRRLGYSVHDSDLDQRIRDALARIFGLA